MKKIKNYGFTLSEVLITLAIIGIVAAITVPTIMANYTKQAKSAKLKKAASVVSQACKKALADNGTGDIRNTDLYEITNNNSTEEEATRILGKYFNITESAKNTTSDFPFQKGLWGNVNGRKYAVLNDGTTISPYRYIWNSAYKPKDYLAFLVDIDGIYKGYNLTNEDVFLIQLNNDCSLQLNDVWEKEDGSNSGYLDISSCSDGMEGHTDFVAWCFQAIVKEGWEINYKIKNKGQYKNNYYDYYMKNNGEN